MRMFDVDPPAAQPAERRRKTKQEGQPDTTPVGVVVRVVPDVGAIARQFDYVVPPKLAGSELVQVGTIVRIPLHGRRVAAWVVAIDVEPPPDVTLKAITKVTGLGPPAHIVELAEWAAWRWAGPVTGFLRTASPPTAVRVRPRPSGPKAARSDAPTGAGGRLPEDALAAGARSVVRIPPGQPVTPVIRAAMQAGPALVLLPSLGTADAVARRLRQEGQQVALHPHEWAAGLAGATVVGTRAAAWAPVEGLSVIVVVDEHDEAYQEERAPTWHARDVAVERARRAGIPCILTSPCPTLEALRWGTLIAPTRSAERDGWPAVDLVDRRTEDQTRLGLYSETFVRALRASGAGRVVCVLNRTGRARLLACRACGELARCERCGSAVAQVETAGLHCPACGLDRPSVCLSCGATKLRARRLGVSRVREELEALAGEPVMEVTASTRRGGVVEGRPGPVTEARLVVGTEAALHRELAASMETRSARQPVALVAFLDFDQELLAPRYRAGEQALALLARAVRLLGGRDRGGRLLVQTTMPDHPVLQAALRADPTIVSADEAARREALELPPFSATASVTGEAAEAFVEALEALTTSNLPQLSSYDDDNCGKFDDDAHLAGVDILGPADGRWLLRAPDHETLGNALAAAPRPPGRLRIEVDPLRI